MGSLNTWTTEVITELRDIESCEDLCSCHGNQIVFWCLNCKTGVCRGCEQDHVLISMSELNKEKVQKIHSGSASLSKLLNDAYSLDNKRQNVIMKLIEAIGTIKADLENELVNNGGNVMDYVEIQNLIRHSRTLRPHSSNYKTLITMETRMSTTKSALETYIYNNSTLDTQLHPSNVDSYKIVYNYVQSKFKDQLLQLTQSPSNCSVFPKYFVDMEIGGVGVGRVVIATRPDIAPKMCENFKLLMGGERGVGYRGCTVFQCWKGESVITGDFEYNNGRGGFSIFNKNLFLPEDTKLISSRGAIGMRRTQKRHDSKGLVGSQFRIILQDMPGFTGIFGHVISGLNIIDKISEYGDTSGNPTVKVCIADCGAY